MAKKAKSGRAKTSPSGSSKAKGRPLVIVESPAKAKTINKILGSGYVVKASMGHVRDLPKRAFGIDVDKDFEPTYRTIRGKSQILAELKASTKAASMVYLAPDPDREGEAIAWHLVQALRIPSDKARRVTFNEITKKGVLGAFQKPHEISMERVHAQQARRLLDRIVGYKLSPLLWKKVARGLSAGRVQSVAVRLIVEREREIRAFKPEEYWTITAHLARKGGASAPFRAELTKVDGKELKVGEGKLAASLVAELGRERYVVESVQQREKIEKSPPPFTTSLLQQQASIKLRFSTSRAMFLAQQLYEGIELGDEGHVGLITYMRTDSFRVADEAVAECRAYIEKTYGREYLPETPLVRAAKKGAQEAHEAIRPTSVERTPEMLKPYLTDDQFRLYRLIWRRFVASQMMSAAYLMTDASIKAGRGTFLARGRELKFDGYTALTGHLLKKDEQILPPLSADEELDLQKLDPARHFTEPPPRYTEASLVKTLERFGIGRPSTYAPIITTIQERGYVTQLERKLKPTELGEIVTEKLVRHFREIMDTGFTAEMEKELDRIEEGRADWVKLLRTFYDTFIGNIDRASEKMTSIRSVEPEQEVPCEKCGKPMLIKWNRFGKFLACSGYPECKSTKPLQQPEVAGEKCDQCQAPMVIKSGRFGRFLACSRYPECKSTRPLPRGNRRLQVPAGWEQSCEKCGSKMAVRFGRRGPFIACSGYPNCKNTQRVPKEWFQSAKPAGAPGPNGQPAAESPDVEGVEAPGEGEESAD